MSVLIACPKCEKKLKIEDSVLGKNIKCPGCATVFATKAPAGGAPAAPPAKTAPSAPPRKAAPPPDDDDEDDRPAKKPAAKAARDDDEDDDDRPAKKPAAKKSRDDDDDEDDRPAKKPAAKAARDDDDDEDDRLAKKPAAKATRDDDDDEDDRPAKKSAAKKGRASDDDDDEDDRPAKKAKKKGSGGKVLLIVGAIVLLLCGGCGALGYWGWVKFNEGVGAATDFLSKMTGPEFHAPTGRQGPVIPGPGLPGPDTKKVAGGPGDKPGGPKPGEKPKFASEQQLADAMFDDPTKAGATYGPLLQLKGKVTKVTMTPDGKVSEIFFEPQVQDLMTREKKPFPITCLLANPLPKDLAPVGQMVTVKGNLTGAKASATLTDCTVVFGP